MTHTVTVPQGVGGSVLLLMGIILAAAGGIGGGELYPSLCSSYDG